MMIKKGLLALSLAASMAVSTLAMADAPHALFIQNDTNSMGTAEILGYQSPVIIRAHGQTVLPWSAVSLMCSFSGPNCVIDVISHAEAKHPVKSAEITLDVATGNITVNYERPGYTVEVNGPGNVTLHGGMFS